MFHVDHQVQQAQPFALPGLGQSINELRGGFGPRRPSAIGLRQSGKIYVVVAAVVIIVAGLLFYLVSLDRKVSKLEQEIKK